MTVTATTGSTESGEMMAIRKSPSSISRAIFSISESPI